VLAERRVGEAAVVPGVPVVLVDAVVVAVGREVVVHLPGRVVDGVEESVELLAGVVDVDGRADRPRHVERVVKRLRAVVAGAHRDAAVVQDGGEVVPVDAIHVERDEAGPLLARRRAVRLHVVAGVEAAEEVLREVVLVVADGVHPEVVEVVHGGGERDALGDGRRARLELPRELVPRRVREGDVPYHLAAEQERLHRRQEVAPAVEAADAGRSRHLVPGERQEVGVEVRHVHRARRHRLCAVHHHVCVVVVRHRGDVRDRVDGAEHVRDVRDRHHRCVRADDLRRVLQVEVAVVRHLDVPHVRTGSPRDLLPGDEGRVMLHLRQHHLVAGAEFVQPETVRDEVDALGGVLREHDLLAAVRPDELGDPVVGGLVRD